MSNPKITGLTSMYLAASGDSTHTLHSLVRMLNILDPNFDGPLFTYTAADLDLFLSQVNVATAMVINGTTGVESFENYPFFIQCDDASVAVPSYFPASVYYADSDTEQTTPLQKTFANWVTDQNHTLYEYDDSGTTKYFAGDFQRHGLDFATQVNSESGFDVWDKSTAVSNM